MARDPSDCASCASRLNCVTAHMQPADFAAVQAWIRPRRMHQGDALAVEGEVAASVRVIKTGSAFGYRLGVDGRTRPVGMMARGSAVGLFGVFGQPTPVSVSAASDVHICEIPVRTMSEVAARDEAFSHHLASAAVQACGSIAAWSEAMRLRGVGNQLAYALLLLSGAAGDDVELPTHVALAELLGTTRETVARGLATLEQEGAIARKSRKQCGIVRARLLARLDAPA